MKKSKIFGVKKNWCKKKQKFWCKKKLVEKKYPLKITVCKTYCSTENQVQHVVLLTIQWWNMMLHKSGSKSEKFIEMFITVAKGDIKST